MAANAVRRVELNHIIVEYMKLRLRSRGYEWTDAPHFASDVTREDQRILSALIDLSGSLKETCGQEIQEMTERAEGQHISDYTSFKTIADEVFKSGFKWSHFVTLLLFCSELSFVRGVRDRDVDFISSITEWVTRYSCQSQQLKQWVESHGGWDGIIPYAAKHAAGSTTGRIIKGMTIIAGMSIVVAGVAIFVNKNYSFV